ncbi:sensor domain-containing protein [Mycolicibacterium sp. XJ870]
MAIGTGWARLCTAGAAVIASVLLAGCVTTVTGSALRDPDAPPLETTLEESDLDGVLLPVEDLNNIVGSFDLEVSLDLDDLNDNSAAVSDQDCLGAAFGAQERVYGDSGWTAARDQIVREPGDDNPHWLEQAVVLYPSAEQAQDFFDVSQAMWDSCVGSIVTFDSENLPLEWAVSEVTVEESLISQMSTPKGAPSGGCHHAMSVASNVIVEAWACGDDIDSQAAEIAAQIVSNIENI